MSTTYETFKTIARYYEGDDTTESILAHYRQSSTTDVTVAYLFVRNYGVIASKNSWYFSSLPQEDVDSAILEAIYMALKNYSYPAKASIHTFLTTYASNGLRAANSRITKGNKVALLNATRFEALAETKDNSSELLEVNNEIAVACSASDEYFTEEDQVHDELNSLILSLELSETQQRYLSIIIKHPTLKDTEVADIMNVNRSRISNLKKTIRKKVANLGLSY